MLSLSLPGVIKRRISSEAAWSLFFARDTLVLAIRKLHGLE